MGMKIKDQHLWDGECEITVGALLALTDDDKRRVKIDGKPREDSAVKGVS